MATGPYPQDEGSADDYKGSYKWPGSQKRVGLGARYEQAMRVAENQLRKEGVPDANLRAAAAVMVGNASAESELIPQTVHDRGTGYGIYGARLDRRSKMLNWLKANNYAADSLVGQTREMAIEAHHRGGHGWEALRGATQGNLGAAGRQFEHYLESPKFDNNRNAQIAEAWRAHGHAARRPERSFAKWMKLPKDKRRTEEQVAAFAKMVVQQNEFQHSRRDPYQKVMGWLAAR